MEQRCVIRVLSLLVKNLVVLCWAISSWSISPLLKGSYAEQAYSSDGLTRDVYACCFTEVDLMSRFRHWREPNTLLAFVQTLLTTLTILPENVMIKNGIYLYKLFWNSWYWEDFNSWFRLFLTVGVATDRGARENIIVSSRQNILQNCKYVAISISSRTKWWYSATSKAICF